MKVGDKVIIQDFSDAHGDTGTIYAIQDDGIILVEFDANEEKGIEEGTLWPILSEDELKLIKE